MAAQLQYTTREEKFIASMKKMSGSVGELAAKVNIGLNNGFKESNYLTRNLDRGFGQLGNRMKSFGSLMTLGVTLPMALAGKSASDAFAEYDSLRRGLANFYPTIDGLNNRLSEMRELAKLPGLGFQEAIQGDVRLQAVGLTAEQSTKVLREFSNAIAQTGGGKQQLNEVTVQLGQMAAKSKVLSQDLRPIIENAPAVATALKEMFGTVSSDEISKQLEATGKTSTDFIDMLLTEMEKAPRVTGGWKNSLENLSDTLYVARARSFELAEESFNLTGKIEGLSSFVEGLVSAFEGLPKPIRTMIFGTTALVTVLGPLSYGLGSIVTLLPKLAAGLYSTQMAAGALTLGVGALVSIILSLRYETNKYNEILEANANLNRDAQESIQSEISSAENYIKILTNKKSTLDQVNSAKEQLRKLSPEFKDALSKEVTKIDDVNKALGTYKKNLLLVAKQKQNNANLDNLLAAKAEVEKGVLSGEKFLKPLVKTGLDFFSFDAIVNGFKTVEEYSKNKAIVLADVLEDINEQIQKTLDNQAELAKELVTPSSGSKATTTGNVISEFNYAEHERTQQKIHSELMEATEKLKKELDNRNEALRKRKQLEADILSGKITPTGSLSEITPDDTRSRAAGVIGAFLPTLDDSSFKKWKEEYEARQLQAKEFAERQLEMFQRDVHDQAAMIGADVLSSLFAGDSLQKTLRGLLQQLGNFAIQLGRQYLKISTLMDLFKKTPSPAAALALIAGGSIVRGLASQMSVPALAQGGVTTSPTLAMIGDNASGREMVMPWEKTSDFASKIAKDLNGGRGGELRAELSGDTLLLWLDRANRKYK